MAQIWPPPAPMPLIRRGAGSLPYPNKPAGTRDETMPFDHLVVVMMENHSFDNLLGALPRSKAGVDGLTFNSAGVATNSNPVQPGSPNVVTSFPLPNTGQGRNVSQSWAATHEQINGGKMNGFVAAEKGAKQPMGYYPPEVLPFAYSLAETFCVANRWFSSVPGPTYPNRRFLLAGTAWGGTITDPSTLLDPPPPNGTIFDRLSDNNVNWCDYFTDIPMTMVIPSIVLGHTNHHAHISKFFHDCQAGTLPAVSLVDPGIGVLSSLATAFKQLPQSIQDIVGLIGANPNGWGPAETEEDPQEMYFGEAWAHKVIEAVLQSPLWPRTLLIYTYDEHGGYYDHVPPPTAIPPDNIAPNLQPGDPAGGYDRYGPRVPAVVVSPYARPSGVTNVIYDHTSVLATIERKFNIPALTNRDANAATIMDFLDPSTPTWMTPPIIAGPSASGPSGPLPKPPAPPGPSAPVA
jgi:phospholipase C